ncbi:hypothetical protein E4T56_gene2944 [Termitomyces sp. T112]|nr:hypothetical protein E4T56_gene2944 [Termitomyces sp. T112]
MSITAVTADSLPSDVPKLLSDGVNWGIFEICFSAAVRSKGKWPHFDGSELHLSPSPDNKATAIMDWDKAELSGYNLLLQWIPDSAAMKLCHYKTVVEAWAALTKEYMQKGSLRVKKEELASVGVDIDDKDYCSTICSTIISSLPPSLATYANFLLMATKLLSSLSPDATLLSGSSDIDPNTLIIVISEEYDCQRV